MAAIIWLIAALVLVGAEALSGELVLLMLAGVPIGVSLGLAGTLAIAAANADALWWGTIAAPQNGRSYDP